MSDGTLTISQIPLVAAIIAEIAKQSGNQKYGCRPDQLNAVITAANSIIEAFKISTVHSKQGEGLQAWLNGHDTGLSSMAMAGKMFGVFCRDPQAYPLDPGDFGRCYRFLRAVPGSKDKLPMMAEVNPTWAGLVAAWDELEKLYEEESPSGWAPKLYARMRNRIHIPYISHGW